MPQYQVLEQELDNVIARLYKDSEKHKRFHRRLRYTMFCMTALSTILASAGAFSANYRELLLMAVVITTAVASLVTSVESIRKPGELGLHERRTHHELVDLRRELLFTAKEATETQLWQLFYRMQTVLNASVAGWAKLKPEQESDSDAREHESVPLRLAVKRRDQASANLMPQVVTGRGVAADTDATLVRMTPPAYQNPKA